MTVEAVRIRRCTREDLEVAHQSWQSSDLEGRACVQCRAVLCLYLRRDAAMRAAAASQDPAGAAR